MAFNTGPRIRETTTTTGTGTLNLAGPTLAMRTFVAGIGTGNTTRYCVVSGNGVDWEIGTGTVTAGSPDTLSRTTILASTNGGAAISLVGTSRVFCCLDPFGRLSGCSDVVITGIANNDILGWDAATSRWTNRAPAAGGGLYSQVMSAVPTSAGTGLTTWRNQGSATVTDGATGLEIDAPSNGSAHNWRLREKAVSNQNSFIATVLMALNFNWTAADFWGGIGFNDGTKLVMAMLAYQSTQPTEFYIINFTNVTTQSSAPFQSTSHAAIPSIVWIQVELDATKLYVRLSIDGTKFTEIYSVLKASAFLGSGNFNNFCFGINPFSSNGGATLMSFA